MFGFEYLWGMVEQAVGDSGARLSLLLLYSKNLCSPMMMWDLNNGFPIAAPAKSRHFQNSVLLSPPSSTSKTNLHNIADNTRRKTTLVTASFTATNSKDARKTVPQINCTYAMKLARTVIRTARLETTFA